MEAEEADDAGSITDNEAAAEAEEKQAAEETYDEEEGEEEQKAARPPKKKPYAKCNQRIDELATPNKRMFLALWNEHAYHLSEDKVINLKQILQQLYAMSPEETAKYFAELRAQAKSAYERRKLKLKLRKYLREKHKEKQKEHAYCVFKKLLKCGITYAVNNPVPPLVSIRLRHLSNIILEQLCELRKVEIPDRIIMERCHLSCQDKLGKILISIADWMAIAVERLHYAAQVSTDELTGRIVPLGTCECVPEAPCGISLGEPQAASTPKQSPFKMPHDSSVFRLFGEPLAASTPKQSPIKLPHDSSLRLFGEPLATSSPKQSPVKLPHDSVGPLGQPLAASSPKQSPIKVSHGTGLGESKISPIQAKYSPVLSLGDECPAKVPFYSFVEDGTATGKQFDTSGVYNTTATWGFPFDRTRLELPPYSFKGVDPATKRNESTKDSGIWSGSKTGGETYIKRKTMSKRRKRKKSKYCT